MHLNISAVTKFFPPLRYPLFCTLIVRRADIGAVRQSVGLPFSTVLSFLPSFLASLPPLSPSLHCSH